MFSITSSRRPLAILAVAAGLVVTAAGPAHASSKIPSQGTSGPGKVTMEDILITSVTSSPGNVTMEDILVTSLTSRAQPGTGTKRARHHGRHHRGGHAGGVKTGYDVRDQPQV